MQHWVGGLMATNIVQSRSHTGLGEEGVKILNPFLKSSPSKLYIEMFA